MNIMRIREIRKERGLTQVQLAKQIGVAQNVVSDWENETYLPKARDLPRLASILGVKIEDLFLPYSDESIIPAQGA